jgi:hypothetical protein
MEEARIGAAAQHVDQRGGSQAKGGAADRAVERQRVEGAASGSPFGRRRSAARSTGLPCGQVSG